VLAIARGLGRRRVVASHHHDNPASGRVLRKAGFRPTGVVERRYSAGRGELVAGPAYTLNLGEDEANDQVPMEMPAAA